MNKKILIFLGLVLSLSIFYFGCGGLSDISTQNYGILLGTVKDTSGTAISAATVTIGSSSTTTNEQGYFSLSNLSSASSAIVRFSKSGYVGTQKTVSVSTGKVLFVEAVMQAETAAQNLDASSGGAINVTSTSTGNAVGSVVIPANALEYTNGTDYSGTAKVSLTLFDPTTEGGRDAFFGDFLGIPSGATAAEDNWAVFDLVVNSSGEVVSFTGVGTIATDVTASDGEAFSPSAAATGGNPLGTASIRTLAIEK